ncbi:MAG: helix-turn-helix transcriptional regulator [Candidatus Sungbacteria bacterium]|nr:helix-turn-helix transcriptional regulator [Candidatus Sungbacteria bacterium]
MSGRAVKHVRQSLGTKLRVLRKSRGLSQEHLGERSNLSGKFIGEVERSEKSISVDSLWRVAAALEMPLRDLVDADWRKPVTDRDKKSAEIMALLRRKGQKELAMAYALLQALFGR